MDCSTPGSSVQHLCTSSSFPELRSALLLQPPDWGSLGQGAACSSGLWPGLPGAGQTGLAGADERFAASGAQALETSATQSHTGPAPATSHCPPSTRGDDFTLRAWVQPGVGECLSQADSPVPKDCSAAAPHHHPGDPSDGFICLASLF